MYRIIRETYGFIDIYYPQRFDVGANEWDYLDWGYGDDWHREWAFTLKGAKRKIAEWRHMDGNPEVVWKE